MGRKNKRDPGPEPVEIVAPVTPMERHRYETRDERDARLHDEWRRRRERNDRRTDKRVAEAVDWSRCCIPGCDYEIGKAPQPLYRDGRPQPPVPQRARDVGFELPLCPRHLTIICKQGQSVWDDPDVEKARERYARQRVTIEVKAERYWDKDIENDGAEGQLYFVRLNGMVKVGWSSRLRSRLKSYGAAAEILCHFPGTRADETLLHRQLRPYLAKGREWYEDCDLIRDVVAGYIRQHGEPSIFPFWTEPKPPTIRPRRAG